MAVAADGGVRVVSVKGTGNNAAPGGGHNTLNYEGSVSSYPPALLERHAAGLREVRAANAPKFEPAGGVANLAALGIRHVFLIIKENRTYDQVLSDLPRGEREPRYLMYGRDVTPNHHALAEQYVLLGEQLLHQQRDQFRRPPVADLSLGLKLVKYLVPMVNPD